MKADTTVLNFLTSLRAEAVKKEINATSAVRLAIEKFPDATRIGVKHAAIAVGINARTARNTFDRVKNGN